ncbi:MAG: arginine--tRNA ligase [Nanoarchaeota archaeon]|nr:arginine--tRNA ligase [Nanoarchaeota archaeon]
MQTPWTDLKKEIAKQVKKITKIDVSNLIEEPNILGHGDLALPCFALSKQFKISPNEISEDLAGQIKIKYFNKIESLGPYVNFYIDWNLFGKNILKEINKDYGKTKIDKNKNVMVEFSTANTNKSLHIGHTRNIVIGDSLSKIMSAAGFNVIKVDYMGDIGLHIAKTIYAYDHWGKGKAPKEKPDVYIGKLYSMFAKRMDKKPELELKAREVLKKWEEGDKETRKTWIKLKKWALEGINETYNRFGIKFDHVYYESEFEESGKKFVDTMLKKQIAFKAEEGQIVANLEKYGIPNFIILRSDGTSLYQTKELGLIDEKFTKYKLFKSINVVGREQELYFEQCYKVMDLLNHKSAGKCHHLSYGLVMGTEGKMSGRTGEAVFLDNLLDDTKKIIMRVVSKKYKKKEAEKIAEDVAVGAIKYALIKYSPDRSIMFDQKEITKYEGDTGPYLQYTYARANSILKKAKRIPKNYDATLLTNEREIGLIKLIARYPEFIEKSARELRPHHMANYAYMLAETFNNFYQTLPVIGKDVELESARLKLVDSVKTVLGNSLSLLGIPLLDKM